MKNKIALFMPSQGVENTPQKYIDDWKGFAEKFQVNIKLVDNSLTDSSKEREKLRNSNILIISGGDPFQLLINLRNSGLDRDIIRFTEKENFIIAGYSAGAYVLTPTLKMARIFNINYPGGLKYKTQDQLKDLSGLGIVDFEIIAHYSETHHKSIFKDYIEDESRVIKTISDNEFLVIDL
jgi:peptidase E